MKKIVILFICMFLFVGCNSKNSDNPTMVFKGENNKCEAEFKFYELTDEDIEELKEIYDVDSKIIEKYKPLYRVDNKLTIKNLNEEDLIKEEKYQISFLNEDTPIITSYNTISKEETFTDRFSGQVDVFRNLYIFENLKEGYIDFWGNNIKDERGEKNFKKSIESVDFEKLVPTKNDTLKLIGTFDKNPNLNFEIELKSIN